MHYEALVFFAGWMADCLGQHVVERRPIPFPSCYQENLVAFVVVVVVVAAAAASEMIGLLDAFVSFDCPH